MSAKNKKGKKKTILSLNEFHNLGNEEGSEQQQQTLVVHRNWADEMENHDCGGEQTPAFFVVDRSMLPTAPKSVLGPDIDLALVPKEKPFRANLANISYDADENSIKTFFKDAKIESINLAKTDRGSGHRGFGFVDFEDRESLICALCKNDVMLLTRLVRVTLKNDGDNRGGDRGGRGNRDDGQTNKSDLDIDWRRREEEPEAPMDSVDNRRDYNQHDQRSGGGGYQGRASYPSRGGYQNRQESDSNWTEHRSNRPSYQQSKQSEDGSFGGDRSGNRSERGGRFSGGAGYGGQRTGGEGGGYQRTGGYGRSGGENSGGGYGGGRNDGARNDGARSGGEGGGYGGQRSGGESGGYRGGRPHQQRNENLDFNRTNETAEPENVATEVEVPKERPKLNLQPRTKPIESPEVIAASSIFGGAKPVDTAARERAIEEKN